MTEIRRNIHESWNNGENPRFCVNIICNLQVTFKIYSLWSYSNKNIKILGSFFKNKHEINVLKIKKHTV